MADFIRFILHKENFLDILYKKISVCKLSLEYNVYTQIVFPSNLRVIRVVIKNAFTYKRFIFLTIMEPELNLMSQHVWLSSKFNGCSNLGVMLRKTIRSRTNSFLNRVNH